MSIYRVDFGTYSTNVSVIQRKTTAPQIPHKKCAKGGWSFVYYETE